MTTPAPDPLDASTAALAAAVLEVARHVEGSVLPAPRLFALARSAELMAASPSLAALLGAADGEAGAPDDLHLTPIDLDDGSPTAADPLAVLESAQWPELAAGGAIVCDLAPSAWSARDDEKDQKLPSGSSLRVVVAALADGTTWSAVQRSDKDDYVLGAALLPEISQALVQTLQAAD
ncbi:PPA1309 family protein [Brachybacterium sp. AOP42-C2-15]|uniref:PPA1309 family protein n=1 Tax=unclassified Brachybacterium TaxID=2623841 RepID=UPI003F90082D